MQFSQASPDVGCVLIANTCVRLCGGTTVIFYVTTWDAHPPIVYTKSTVSLRKMTAAVEVVGGDLFSSRAHLRFKRHAALLQFCTSLHNTLVTPLSYDKNVVFSEFERCVTRSVSSSSWPIKERMPPTVSLWEKLQRGVGCKVDLQK